MEHNVLLTITARRNNQEGKYQQHPGRDGDLLPMHPQDVVIEQGFEFLYGWLERLRRQPLNRRNRMIPSRVVLPEIRRRLTLTGSFFRNQQCLHVAPAEILHTPSEISSGIPLYGHA